MFAHVREEMDDDQEPEETAPAQRPSLASETKEVTLSDGTTQKVVVEKIDGGSIYNLIGRRGLGRNEDQGVIRKGKEVKPNDKA